MFGRVGGCNRRFVFIAYVFQNVKRYRRDRFFLAHFWAKFGWCSKICKLVFEHNFKSPRKAKNTIVRGWFSGPSRGYYLGQVKMSGWRHHQDTLGNDMTRTKINNCPFLGRLLLRKPGSSRTATFSLQGFNFSCAQEKFKHDPDRNGNTRWNTNTKKKKDKTPKVRKPRWMTKLQRRKGHWKHRGQNRQQNLATRYQKKHWFSLFFFFFRPPFVLQKALRRIFQEDLTKTTSRRKTVLEKKTGKSENPIFPCFFDEKFQKLIRGPGGGGNFYRPWLMSTFFSFWWVYYKKSGFGTFRAAQNERKSCNSKS